MDVGGTEPRCAATTKDGKPCSARPRPGSARCPWHDEGLAARRKAWSAKGGQARSNANRARRNLPAGVLTVDELRGVLGATIAKVLKGSVDPGVGNAVANLARAYGSLTEAAKAEELAARLDELEALARRGGAA